MASVILFILIFAHTGKRATRGQPVDLFGFVQPDQQNGLKDFFVRCLWIIIELFQVTDPLVQIGETNGLGVEIGNASYSASPISRLSVHFSPILPSVNAHVHD
jgi:hypothetical protein